MKLFSGKLKLNTAGKILNNSKRAAKEKPIPRQGMGVK